MSAVSADPFNHAVHTANIWLAGVGQALGTRDRRYAHRVMRTWLQTLRDRLTVDAAVKFGQQLPELLRGTYYDGWEPRRVPVKYNVNEYVRRFAAQAGISLDEVPATSASITGAIASHMSPGQVDEALAELPTDLRDTVSTGGQARAETAAAPAPARAAQPVTRPTGDQIADLEDQVSALTEAVRTLAHGLEDGQLIGAGVDQGHVARAARLADEILLASGPRRREQQYTPATTTGW